MTELPVPGADVDAFYAAGPRWPLNETGLNANQYVLLRDRANPSHTRARPLRRRGEEARRRCARRARACWGIRPRNKEQHYALDLLLDDDIKLVTLVGKAGTGKTLLALAAGLQKAVEDGIYTQLLVSRPIMPLGRDIGFLPGDVDEKLNPWMQPIFDNLEFLLGLRAAAQDGPRPTRSCSTSASIQVEPLTYIRGRSLPQPVHHRRRGAEPHAARGEDDHHARPATARRSCSPATRTRSTTRTSTRRRTG